MNINELYDQDSDAGPGVDPFISQRPHWQCRRCPGECHKPSVGAAFGRRRLRVGPLAH
jgi:hypothetical protein